MPNHPRIDVSAVESESIENDASAARVPMPRKVAAYWALTKPGVIRLLLVATLPTMIFAKHGFPDPWLTLATLIGGAFAAGGAGALNCYIDRDMDKVMKRTKNRPLVTGELTPREALVFASLLGATSLVILHFGANLLAAALGAGAILFYVVVYTLLLKRHTPQNIVWGGIAGCFPVLIAWAAVRGTLEWPALVLFLVIFFWTPPHYWPLSTKHRSDYQAANVPMLGAVAPAVTVSRRIVTYTWVTVLTTLLMVPIGGAGIVYTATAVASGAWFLYETHRLHRRARASNLEDRAMMRVFRVSIPYLSLLFLGLAIDPFVGSSLVAP